MPSGVSSHTPEEFVRAWQSASSVEELIPLLGITRNSLFAKAALYRKRGVKLKNLAPEKKNKKLDAEALNKIVEEVSSTSRKEK